MILISFYGLKTTGHHIKKSMESDNKITDKILSKSKYISGIQCLKYLWYLVNEPDSIPPYDDAALFRFQQGHEVGELAKKLYPEGVEIEHGNDIRAELKIAEIMTGLCSHEKLSGSSDYTKPEKISATERIPLFEPAFSYKFLCQGRHTCTGRT